jgi:hypothetical protein
MSLSESVKQLKSRATLRQKFMFFENVLDTIEKSYDIIIFYVPKKVHLSHACDTGQ